MSEPQEILQTYLRETGDKLSAIALRIGRSPSTLTRALAGERNPSHDLALDFERGTKGRVTAFQFLSICIAARARAQAASRESAA